MPSAVVSSYLHGLRQGRTDTHSPKCSLSRKSTLSIMKRFSTHRIQGLSKKLDSVRLGQHMRISTNSHCCIRKPCTAPENLSPGSAMLIEADTKRIERLTHDVAPQKYIPPWLLRQFHGRRVRQGAHGVRRGRARESTPTSPDGTVPSTMSCD